MENETLTCPECGSENVTVTHVQKFMANTGEHYCHVTKTQDQDSEAGCLDCGWSGWRDDLKSNAGDEATGAALCDRSPRP